MDHPDRVVLHVAGPDRPGVTARLAEVIAEEHGSLIDIGQSVVHGYLVLSAIVDIPPNSNTLKRLLFAVGDLGLRLEVSPFGHDRESPRATVAVAVTLLGSLRDGKAMAAVTQFMAGRGMNIREIRSIGDAQLEGLELIVDLAPGKSSSADIRVLRGELLSLGMTLGVDLAAQRDDIFRRNKRLVCMDVDSTFVRGEFIDELADLAGVKAQVAKITERAMRGELDFRQALNERVQLLAGVSIEQVHQVADRAELTSGAERFVQVLKGLGYKIGLVSGGFTIFVDQLKAAFDLDFAFSNELEVADGKLTGRVRGAVVDAERKAQVLKDMAQAFRFRLAQSVAIGDGANDVLMLQTAGLGIAFRAKPKLREAAHMSLNNERLDALLVLMGYNAGGLHALDDRADPRPGDDATGRRGRRTHGVRT